MQATGLADGPGVFWLASHGVEAWQAQLTGGASTAGSTAAWAQRHQQEQQQQLRQTTTVAEAEALSAARQEGMLSRKHCTAQVCVS